MRKMSWKHPFVRALLILLLIGSWLGYALEPPTREQIERYKRDGTLAARIAAAKAIGNHIVEPRIIERMRNKLRTITLERRAPARGRMSTRSAVRTLAPPRPTGLPTTGTVKILALLIAFSDYPGVTPVADVESKLFGDGSGGYPYESLRNYYRRASYNQLEFEGEVLGWYTAPYARSEVDETSTGRQNLIKEALDYYDAQGFDFSEYDNDGDGDIDYFCVLWTGPHGEWSSFWWGYYTGWGDSSYTVDGKGLSRYSWQWELYNYPSGTYTPRVVMHETGHALGLPDYYDYDDTVGPDGGVGNLDMMDANVGDHNCFSKFMLDWITPTVVSSAQQAIALRSSGEYPDALIFMPSAAPGQIFGEYFMVQNRYRTHNDSTLFTGTDGLVVWHVDSRLNEWETGFLYNNSYTEHKLLRLVQADGLDEIENFNASADAEDYYQEGMTFGPLTTPNTDRYDGTTTGMGIGNIEGAGTPITLDVFDLDAPPTCSILNISAGQILYDTVQIDVSTGDDVGIDRVELYVDNNLTATTSVIPVSFVLDTTSLVNGPKAIRVVAYDTINQTASNTVTVTVDNIYAPSNVVARAVVNRGLFVREHINLIQWIDNLANISVIKYRVYRRNGLARELLAEVNYEGTGGLPYSWWHRRVSADESYTYEVVAVGSLNREGEVGTASIR